MPIDVDLAIDNGVESKSQDESSVTNAELIVFQFCKAYIVQLMFDLKKWIL